MTAAKEKLSRAIDVTVPVLILLQVATVSLSIAVSSVAFTVWMILWALQLVIDRKKALAGMVIPSLKYISLFILLYFVAEALSRMFAVYPEGAFLNFKRLLLFAIFYVSISKIPGTTYISGLLTALVLITGLISFAEITAYVWKFGEMIQTNKFSEIRIDYFNYPLTSAEIKMMIILSVLPVIFAKSAVSINRPLLIAMLIPIAVSMLLTQSRNVYLALGISLMLYGIIENRKFLIGFVMVALALYFVLPTSVTERLASIFDVNHPSNASRLVMWETGFRIFKDHMIFGTGDSKMLELYSTYTTPRFHSEGVHLHSNFMMILVTTGIVGFAAFCGYFFSLISASAKLYSEYRRRQNALKQSLALGSVLVIVSFLIAGIFEWSFGDHEVMTVFFFLTAVPFILTKDKEIEQPIELHGS